MRIMIGHTTEKGSKMSETNVTALNWKTHKTLSFKRPSWHQNISARFKLCEIIGSDHFNVSVWEILSNGKVFSMVRSDDSATLYYKNETVSTARRLDGSRWEANTAASFVSPEFPAIPREDNCPMKAMLQTVANMLHFDY